MASNLGSLLYGDLNVLPGFDTSTSGFGNLNVAGNTLLAGASTDVSGTLNALGAATLGSTLHVAGQSTFDATTTFNALANFVNGLTVSSVIDATDANSGAFQVKGGLSVALSSYIGGLLDVVGRTNLRNTLTVAGTSTFNEGVTITSTAEATSNSTGSLRVSGGVTVAGNIRSTVGNVYLADRLILRTDATNGTTYLNSPDNVLHINHSGTQNVLVNQNSAANFTVANSFTANSTGVKVTTTTDSTALASGALQVAGGASIAMSVNVGGNLTLPVQQTVTAGKVVLTNTAQASSVSTGALVVSGGSGVGGNSYVGGILDVASTAGSISSVGAFRFVTSLNGANWVRSADLARSNGSWVPMRFAPVGSQTAIATVRSDGFTIDQTTTSTSSSTGALVVGGGAGVGGNLNVGGSSTFTGTSSFSANVWLNGNILSLGNPTDVTSGLTYSNSTSTGGPFLFGDTGGALGTTAGVTKTALRWDANQNVVVRGNADTNIPTSGALTVVGGVGIAKSLAVGGALYVHSGSWTSTGNDVYINSNGANINLRNTVDNVAGEFESTPTLFNFKTAPTGEGVLTPYSALVVDKVTGYVHVRNTVEATASSTGALQVAGGTSIEKSLWIGEDAIVQGNFIVNGSISTTGISPVSFSNTTNSESVTTGAVVVAGGMGVGLNLYVGGLTRLTEPTQSTSTDSGSLVVSGGVGIASNLNVGGDGAFAGSLTVNGNITSTAGSVQFVNTTQSTSPSTGAVVVGGGVGVGSNLFVGGVGSFVSNVPTTSVTSGSVVVTGGVGVSGGMYLGGALSITDTTQSSSTVTGSIITAGGVGVARDVSVGGNTRLEGTLTVTNNTTCNGITNLNNTTDTSSPTGGSLIVSGGVGIAKRLFVGSTEAATSPANGALVVTGGFGLGGDARVLGNLYLDNAAPRINFNSASFAPPSFTTRSAGTKLLLNSAISATTVDWAVGISNMALWQSIPNNTNANFFRWFGGTTIAMALDGTGMLQLNGTHEATSSTTGALRIAGGAGFAKNIYVGGNANIAGTTFLTGAVTANTDLSVGGILSVSNTTNSTSSGNGAIITTGGLGVAQSVNIGGNITVNGTSSFVGNSSMAGVVTVTNVSESTAVTNGCAVFQGGVGIAKSLNVGGSVAIMGSTTIAGNLIVSGSRTVINTEVLSTRDNILLVNNAPGGSASSGFASKRYQLSNDHGAGDVVQDLGAAEVQGMAQAGSTGTTIVLGTEADARDGFYNGSWIIITSGVGTGQVRRINTYVGASRTATIYTTADQNTIQPIPSPVEGMDWSTVPDATSAYAIFSTQYVTSIFDELADEYAFGYTGVNPASDPIVNIKKRLTLHAGTVKLDKELNVDTIKGYTSGSGVTISNANVKDGHFTGVKSINGNTVDVTDTVTLIDNAENQGVVIPGTEQSGSFMLFCEDESNTGSHAVFFCCGNISRAGMVHRVVSCPGASGESLTVTWPLGSYPSLKFLKVSDTPSGAEFTYNVKVLSV